MKRLFTNIRKEASKLAILSLLAATILSCDSILDFEEGDCTVEYRVKFKYDYNMKYANAFANEVSTVTLYAFDKDGNFVYQQTEAGETLKSDAYSMKVEIDPGDYHLVAWAGLDDHSFAIPLMTNGESTIDQLNVRTNREAMTRANGDAEYVVTGDDRKLSSLWHAENTQVTLTRGNRDKIITMSLVKNTNNIRIILQQSGGQILDVDNFEFSIVDDNGLMDSHNDLLNDDMLKYLPFYRTSGVVDEAKTRANDEEEPAVSMAIAQITTGRLMADKDPLLRITNKKTQEMVLSIPLVRYLLLAKSQEHVIGDQEYLDRQDEYNLTFFLDKNQTWINTTIIINGWTIRLNDFGM